VAECWGRKGDGCCGREEEGVLKEERWRGGRLCVQGVVGRWGRQGEGCA